MFYWLSASIYTSYYIVNQPPYIMKTTQKVTLHSTVRIVDKRSIDPAGLNPIHSFFLLIIITRESNLIQRLLPEKASPRLYVVVKLRSSEG